MATQADALLMNVPSGTNELSQQRICVPNSSLWVIYHERTQKCRPSNDVKYWQTWSTENLRHSVTPTDQVATPPISDRPKTQRICTNLISHPFRGSGGPDPWTPCLAMPLLIMYDTPQHRMWNIMVIKIQYNECTFTFIISSAKQ